MIVDGLCCANRPEVEPPLTPVSLCNGLDLGGAKASEAGEESGADVDLGGMAFEGASHEPLSKQLEAAHLGLDATSAVSAAPGAPDRSAEVTGGPQDVVAGLGTGSGLLPGPAIAAGGDHSASLTGGDRRVTGPGVVGPVGRDLADGLNKRDCASSSGSMGPSPTRLPMISMSRTFGVSASMPR